MPLLCHPFISMMKSTVQLNPYLINVQNMKKLYLLFILLFASSNSFGNFGGYFRTHQLGVGDFLQVSSENKISLKKERLHFILGQRINFHGIFWFENASNEAISIDMAFPQKTFWEAPYSKKSKYYYEPGVLHQFSPKLKIKAIKTSFNDQKYSKYSRGMHFSFGKLVLNKENGGGISLSSETEIKKNVIEYAQIHEAQNPPAFPVILWLIKRVDFKAREEKKIEISFTLPWYYEDQIWSGTRIESDLNRYFEYITETAKTWLGGVVWDFEAKVNYPEEAADNIDFSPKGWVNSKKGEVVLKKKNWAPEENENIRFTWKSDFKSVGIGLAYDPCKNVVYYKDYHWRFLFDGSAQTAWCTQLKTLKKCLPFGFKTCAPNQPKSNYYGCKSRTRKPPKKIKGVKIISGYAKNQQLFNQNSRPKRITFYIGGAYLGEEKAEWKQTFIIKDSIDPQYFEFDKSIDLSRSLHFDIDAVYEGEKFTDICISEISPY